MKPDWLIQTNMDGVDTDSIINEIEHQGMAVWRIDHTMGLNIDFEHNMNHGCVVCYGDIDFVRQVRNRAPFIPGAWCNFNNMKCSSYYAHFGEHLLNKSYVMMPIGDLIRRSDDLGVVVPGFNSELLSNDSKSIFIRPDSGAKLFTGYTIDLKDKHKIQTLIQAVGPETLVVISPWKEILAEWRFVVCDRKVVAGCQYLPVESSNYPETALRLAIKITEHDWQPDLCYTIDIAKYSDGKMYLLEINSFSCSGLYCCNIESVIKYASDAAVKEWKEYCDPETANS